jgi:hypothetical protein
MALGSSGFCSEIAAFVAACAPKGNCSDDASAESFFRSLCRCRLNKLLNYVSGSVMSNPNTTARLLITCPDKPGIVSAVSSFLYNHGANITDLDQHSTEAEGRHLFYASGVPNPASRFIASGIE